MSGEASKSESGADRPVIAVVDDDAEIRASLSALLEENGFAPHAFASGYDFVASDVVNRSALAVLDLKLAGESGLALAARLRQSRDLPIIMLTGTGSEVDKIVGLETGADDYVTKPFNPRELIARIRAVLRRYGAGVQAALPAAGADIRAFGALRLDLAGRSLYRADGSEIALTNAEYRLLEFFLRHPDQVISRVTLLQEMGSDLSQYVDRTIDVLILRLRRKIEPVPSKPMHLQTRRGQGYVFVPDLPPTGSP